MSYNIDHSEYLSGKLYIKRRDAMSLREKHERHLAEDNFLDNLELTVDKDHEELLPIERFSWRGAGVNYSLRYPDDVLCAILKRTTGEATVWFIWEGGDSLSALHIKDGVVTEKKVKISVE